MHDIIHIIYTITIHLLNFVNKIKPTLKYVTRESSINGKAKGAKRNAALK